LPFVCHFCGSLPQIQITDNNSAGLWLGLGLRLSVAASEALGCTPALVERPNEESKEGSKTENAKAQQRAARQT
jgi:hypothetical protein